MIRWHKERIQLRHSIEADPVPIVSDAGVASRGVADGRLIPLFILDTSKRPDIDDMIRAHRHLGPGDAKSAWALRSRFDKTRLQLLLTIEKPSHCTILLEFDVIRQGGVIDQIIQSQGFYLQAGRPGDRLLSTIEHERILVEVPSREFRGEWQRIFRKAVVKDCKRRGLSRAEAKEKASLFIKEWREITSKRMKSKYD